MKTVKSKDGTSIAFNKDGNGPAVILVDGAFCSKDFGPMPKLMKLLSPNFTVFAYDRRGRGESGDTKPYAVQREMEDLDAIIKEAGGSAFLFGMSSGAVLSIRASASGSNVTKLALYEPPFNVDHKYRSPPAGYAKTLHGMIAEGRKSDAVKFFLTKVMGAPGIVAFIMSLTKNWSKMKATANSLPYDAEVMRDSSVPVEELKSISIPVLAIGGEKSPAMLRAAAEAVSMHLPNSQHKILAGQTHNVSQEVLAPVLIDFYKSKT